MPNAAKLLDAHPVESDLDFDALTAAIDSCLECANTCNTCADACLGGDEISEMKACIRLCLDCTDICAVTARVLSRQTAANASVLREVVLACVAACRACAEECESHSTGEVHCEACRSTCMMCAESCRNCEKACGELAGSISV